MGCTLTGYTGSKYCSTEPFFGEPIGLLLVASSYSMTAANFLLQAQWDAAINLGTVIPVMGLKDFTDNSSETRVHDFPNESQTFLAQGKYRFNCVYHKNQKQKIQIHAISGASWSFFIVYSNGIRGCTLDDGVTIKGIPSSMFTVGKETLKTMDAPATMPIMVSVKDYKYMNQYDYSMPISWVDEIDGLTEVDLSISGTPTATSLVVLVNTTINGVTYPITGLAFADFSISGTGTLGISGNFVAASDGTYTFTTVGLINGDIVNIKAPSAIADVELHVISSGALTVAGIA